MFFNFIVCQKTTPNPIVTNQFKYTHMFYGVIFVVIIIKIIPVIKGTKGKNERELEILFNLFVLSDQLLLDRLKNKCEFKLANLVNLKNAVEVFEFSDQYEAQQLKEFAMEFIAVNLTTLIEAKQLETLSLELLRDLASFYRSYFPHVGSRFITPYSDGPAVDSIDLAIPLEFLSDPKFVEGSLDEESNAAKKKGFSSNRDGFVESMAAPVEAVVVKADVLELKGIELDTGTVTEAKVVSEKWEKVGKKVRYFDYLGLF